MDVDIKLSGPMAEALLLHLNKVMADWHAAPTRELRFVRYAQVQERLLAAMDAAKKDDKPSQRNA